MRVKIKRLLSTAHSQRIQRKFNDARRTRARKRVGRARSQGVKPHIGDDTGRIELKESAASVDENRIGRCVGRLIDRVSLC